MVERLRDGHLVIYPTETWYAIGCALTSSMAIQNIVKIKNRDAHKPLPLIAASQEQAARYCELSIVPKKLLDLFWPGPLTLVLHARQNMHPALLDQQGRVAIRVSASGTAQTLANAAGCPIVSSSANISGEPPVRQLSDLSPDLLKKIFFYDPDATLLPEETDVQTQGEKPSTIVEVINETAGNRSLKIWREGIISAEMLRKKDFNVI